MKYIRVYSKDANLGKMLESEACQSHYVNRQLSSIVVSDGYVLEPKGWNSEGTVALGGVVDNQGCYVDGSAVIEGFSQGYDFDINNVEHGDKCIFIGFFHICYGHAITDGLRKLWYLKTDECRKLMEEGAELIYLTTANQDMPVWHIHLLDICLNLPEWTLQR